MMDPIWVVRTLFVLTLTLCGYWLGRDFARGLESSLVALTMAMFIVMLEYATRILSAKKIILTAVGAFAGLAFSRLFYDTLPENMFGTSRQALLTAFNLFFLYFGVVMALRNADSISFSKMKVFITSPREDAMLFDTSVIIDGRIKEMYQQGFLQKNGIVPTFVLEELQKLADSKDAAKRHTGRRGLDHLDAFKDSLPIQLFEKDYPELVGVDNKLIALAKELGVPLLTNDYNLAKVASVHGVRAMNINTLAAALRPNLNIGDQLILTVQREGKDPNQGVGYLEDGTMVVVDDAKPLIGKTVPVTVVSMMQTNAGRLAFGRLLEGFSPSSTSSAAVPVSLVKGTPSAQPRTPTAP